jgi:cell division protein FtsL
VVGFILMIAQIIWIIMYFCIGGYFREKNLIVLLICIIELTVISFIYSENIKMFDTQKVVKSIADCIETEVAAASAWNFGLQSSSAFSMIQYIATIFLSTFLFAFLMDKVVFTASTELYRNFSYEDND